MATQSHSDASSLPYPVALRFIAKQAVGTWNVAKPQSFDWSELLLLVLFSLSSLLETKKEKTLKGLKHACKI